MEHDYVDRPSVPGSLTDYNPHRTVPSKTQRTIKDLSTTCSRRLANLPVCIRSDLGRWQKYRDSDCFADEDKVPKMFKLFPCCGPRIAGFAGGSIWIIIHK